MSYQVLARKWRPHTFDEVVGQTAAIKALTHALDEQRLHHAYLFTGTRGVGKTTLARIIAKCMNCEEGVSSHPCGQCTTCLEIDQGCYPDLIEVDAASRSKVEETRDLLDNVIYAPVRGRYKIYLIDEIHMLSGHSFNALLKTLEEPPAHVKFLFATTDPQRLPVTVVSRCLQFSLTPLTPELIAQQLATIVKREQAQAEPAALAEIAQAAAGSMRDALSLLDQLLAYAQGNLQQADVRAVLGIPLPEQVYALLQALAQRDATQLVQQIAGLAQEVPDMTTVLIAIIESLQQIALVQLVPGSIETHSPYRTQIEALAQQMTPEDVQLYYEIALHGRRDLPYAATPRGGVEMILLRMLAFCPARGEGSVVTPNQQTEIILETKSPPSSLAPSAPAIIKEEVKENREERIEPVPSVAPVESIPLTAETWPIIVKELQITGMTRAVAQHCIFIYADEALIKLAIAPAHAALLNSQQQQRVQEALAAYYGKERILQILVQDLDTMTPAEQHQADLEKRQEQALAALHADNRVQALMNTFEATIISTN